MLRRLRLPPSAPDASEEHASAGAADVLMARLHARLAELEAEPRAGSLATDNAALVAKAFGLSRTEETILAFVIALESEAALGECYERVSSSSLVGAARQLAVILALRARDVRFALRKEGSLRSLPLVEYGSGDSFWQAPLALTRTASQALLQPLLDARDLVKRFLAAGPPATLTVADFPHAAAEIELLVRMLRAALARRALGVNVLVYGPPGTGKTQLVAAIAAAVGATLDAVAFEDEDNDVLEGQRRLEQYALCQRLLRGRRNALLIFDEAEDAFPQRMMFFGMRESGRNKAWTNQLLEHSSIPTFWVSNGIRQMDRAFVRRFDFVLELGQPPRSVRRTILGKHLAGTKVCASELDVLAAREELTPGHVERAARVLKLLRPRTAARANDDLVRVLDANLRAFSGGKRAARVRSPLRYDRALLNASVDPEALLAGLLRSRRGALCFYGPPGTGKTELAHHLARELDMPLQDQRGSELLSPWVGVTEQNIAAMFERARKDGALLLLDEADSFLQSREAAQRSWEVTQVNEMLTQMEAFDGIFVCSTNLVTQLDRASLRRFALKVRFDYLRPAQIEQLFRSTLAMLGCADADPAADALSAQALAEVAALRHLTPGDFAAVMRKLQVLGTAVNAVLLASELVEECRMKNVRGARTLGFTAASR